MIYDADDNPISGFSFPISSGDDVTFQIKVDCRVGLRLYSETVGDLSVEGRRAGIGSYVDLEAGDLDLSAFAGTREEFDIRVTAGTVASLARRSFGIVAGP